MRRVKFGAVAVEITASGSVTRKSLITAWAAMPATAINPAPIPKEHTGTTIAEDGIRITGTPAFTAQVLSALREFLRFESKPGVRLDVKCSELTDIKTGRRIENKFRTSIQLKRR